MSFYQAVEGECGSKKVVDFFSQKPVSPDEGKVVLALLALKENKEKEEVVRDERA